MFGELAALITAILWSFTSIAFSEASNRVGPMYVNVTRMFFAVAYLSITILLSDAPINLSFSQLLFLVISGFIGLIFGDTFLFKSYRSIGARLSMLVMSSAPAIAAVLAFFFLDEKLSLAGVLGIAVTIAGIAIVVLHRKEKPTSKYKVDYTGIFYAFLGAVGQAVGLVFAKFAFNEGDINGFVATFVRVFSALIILYPAALLTKHYVNPVKVFQENRKGLYFTIIGSFIGPFLGITFSLISISYAKVGVASTIMATVPIIMLPIVRLYYKEKLSWVSILGAIAAVAGTAMLFLA
ncbi:MAG: DMT family transporter [Bacteroidota bacterium]